MPPAAPYLPVDTVVRAVTDLTPSLRRVTLSGAALADVAETCLDRRIKLVLPRHADDDLADIPRGADWYAAWSALEPSSRPPVRTYTARAVRRGDRELDLDVVRHGTSGPAGRWVEGVQPGDGLLVVLPVAGFPGIDGMGIAWHPGHARQVLVVADETAAPAATNIAESLPPDAAGHVLIEVPTHADRWQVDAPRGVQVSFLPRDGAPLGSRLTAAIAEIAWPPVDDPTPAPDVEEPETDPDAPPIWEEPEPSADGDHYAWLAGESGVVTALRRHLVRDRGCPRDRIAFMGYWKHGRAEC